MHKSRPCYRYSSRRLLCKPWTGGARYATSQFHPETSFSIRWELSAKLSKDVSPLADDDGEFDEYDDDFIDLDGEEFEEEEAEDVVTALGLGEDDAAPGISTGGIVWGEAGLKAVEKVLKTPAMDGLELYLFRAIVPQKKLDIRLDKVTDLYGSPSIDDIEKFSRMMFLEMDALLGTDAAGEVSFEVSSPGAERQLVLPSDLNRFQKLPLRVEHKGENESIVTQVLELLHYDEEAGMSEWGLANVRANAPMKGRSMSKKQKEMRFLIPVANLVRVRIHVDF